jgi:hypothetical protein
MKQIETEADWLACTDAVPMLEFLRGKVSERKLRLFAVACCRRIWHLLPEEWSRQTVELAEKYADGMCSDEQLAEAGKKASWAAAWAGQGSAAEAAAWVAADKGEDAWVEITAAHAGWAEAGVEAPRPLHCELLRDIFNNPFRPVTLDPEWPTPSAVAVARSIYDDRRFADLPLLADALEEAGCTNADILAHCRSERPHVRGCWIVDLLLGKE